MVESWYNFGVLYEKCKQSDEAVVAYKKALEIDPEEQDARARLLSIQSPMYNPDNTSMLYMKFPAFRIPNNLVIDKKYKKPLTQRGLQPQMQGVGGMMGGMSQMGTEPVPQFLASSASSTQIPGLNQISGASQYPSSMTQQFEEEKRFNPAPSQYPPQILPQNVSGVGMNASHQGQSQPYQAAKSVPTRVGGYQEPTPNLSNYPQNNPRESNNSSFNHTHGMNNPNYDMNAGRQGPAQPQSYQAIQDTQRSVQPSIPYGVENIKGYPPQSQPVSKMVKTEEVGPGQRVDPALYQQQNESRTQSVLYQTPGRDQMQPVPPLNQVAQTLNTQQNIPNLQNSMNQPSNQMYASQPQYNQNHPQYSQPQSQYNQSQQSYNQYQGQYNQPQSQPIQSTPQPVQPPTQFGQPVQAQYPPNSQYNQTQYGQPAQTQFQGGYPPQTTQSAPPGQPPAPPAVLPQNLNIQETRLPSQAPSQMTPQSMQGYPAQDNFQTQSNLAYAGQYSQGVNPAGIPTGEIGRLQNVQDQYAQQPHLMNQTMSQPMGQPINQQMYNQMDAQPLANPYPQIPMNVNVPSQSRIDEPKVEHESESLRSHSQRIEGQRMIGNPMNQHQEMADENAQVAIGTEDTHEQMLNNTVFQPHPEVSN